MLEASEAPHATTDLSKLARDIKHLLWSSLKEFCLPLLLVASIGLLAQASVDCHEYSRKHHTPSCKSYHAYAVVVGVISTFLVLLLIAARRFGNFGFEFLSPDVLFRGTSCALATWWLIAALVLTFSYTYATIGNGYFSCWLGFIAAGSLYYVTMLKEEHQYPLSYWTSEWALLALLLASVIQIISAVVACTGRLVPEGYHGGCSGDNGFIVAVGCISALCCVVLLCLAPLDNNVRYVVGGLLFLWWALGVFISTFGTGHGTGMFRIPGNGYFSSWAALVFAATFVLCTKHGSDEQVIDSLRPSLIGSPKGPPIPDPSISLAIDPKVTPPGSPSRS